MVRRWRKEVDGPLCGSLRTGKGRDVEKDMIKAQMRKEAPLAVPPSADAVVETRDAAAQPEKPHASERAFIPDAPLRILVIGDRKFTDTLQARELDTYLGASPFPSTLSIQTTNLPQPADVRILRRLENWLAGPDLAHGGSAGGVTWSQYSIPPPPPPPPPPTWLEQKKESARAAIARLNPVTALDDGGPPITRDPRSWRPRPVAAAVLSALGTAISATVRVARRGVAAGAKSAYAAVKVWGAQRVAAAKAERARRAQEKEQALVEKERDEAQAQAHASEAGKTLA
jgi:hypothetical protein